MMLVTTVVLASCSGGTTAPEEPVGAVGSVKPGSPQLDGGAPRGDASSSSPQPISPTPALPPPPPPPPPPREPIEPAAFGDGEVTVETVIRTGEERRPISPLVYGMNHPLPGSPPIPPEVLAGTTFVRRGGDRANAYNWETNLSNGAAKRNWANDGWLTLGLANPSAPAEVDRVMIAGNVAGGRRSMVPFVLNDYVAGRAAENIPYASEGFDINAYFKKVELVKPGPFDLTPNLDDGTVYTDEHIDYLRRQFPGDLLTPGPTELMIGSDNEPDLYVSNFPMLQRGNGAAIHASNGVKIGNRLTADDFTQRYLRFAKRVKELWPKATIVGPDHFHFDGYTNFHTISQDRYTDDGRWYMDDFLEQVRAESERTGIRLLDTWDFHWYPQEVFGGVDAWKLDQSKRALTEREIEAIVQGPRSYWDPDYREHSWITDDHLHGPAKILVRLFERIEKAWPGMPLGVTEYFPGGCSHVSSALGVADTLGVFGRMGVHMAAMWPHTCDLGFAYGGFELFRNTDRKGLRFAETSVKVEHPEKAESSVYASIDAANVTVVVINKTNAARRVGLRLFHDAELAAADVYRVDAGHQAPTFVEQAPLTKKNAHVYEAPPMSATLLAFH